MSRASRRSGGDAEPGAHRSKRSGPRLELRLPEPWPTTRWLFVVVGLLLLASTAGQVIRLRLGYDHLKGLIPLFYVDEEASVPAWYSSAALLTAAVLLLLIARAARSSRDHRWRYWAALAALFVGLSLDEVAQIHELLIEPLRGRIDATGYLPYPWVMPGAIFALAVVLVFARFVLGLPRKTRALFVAAGLLFVSGGLGVEMISAGLDFERDPAQAGHVAAVTLQEGLEMCAIVVFLHALLSHLRDRVTEAAIRPRIAERAGRR
jgi:hypothetical protein